MVLWSRRQVGIIEAAKWLSLGEVAQRLQSATVAQVAVTRQLGADAGVRALRRELPGLHVQTRDALVGVQFYSSIITARNYTRRWVETANALSLSIPRYDAAQIATQTVERHAKTIVTTETSTAFSGARRKAAKVAQAEARGRLVILERWDAVLDQFTCPECEHADGETIRLGQDFEHGLPGAVHSRCRCTSHYLYEDPVTASLLAD